MTCFDKYRLVKKLVEKKPFNLFVEKKTCSEKKILSIFILKNNERTFLFHSIFNVLIGRLWFESHLEKRMPTSYLMPQIELITLSRIEKEFFNHPHLSLVDGKLESPLSLFVLKLNIYNPTLKT